MNYVKIIRGYGMNKKNISIALFPTIIMILIYFIRNNSIFEFSSMDLKGLLIISIVLFFPIIFLIQGILVTTYDINKISSISISLVSYLIYLFFIMKETVLEYIVFYLLSYIIGVVIGNVIKKYIIKFKNT